MKMSDVFCCEVDASAFTVISGVVKEYADDSVMPHEYAAHAINSHDRMVEEIAELKGLVTLISLNSTFQTNMPHEADLIEKLLNKND